MPTVSFRCSQAQKAELEERAKGNTSKYIVERLFGPIEAQARLQPMGGQADTLTAAIAQLAASTASARLRQVMPQIEQKIEQGVRHEQIVAALRQAGVEVTLETFRKALYRYRVKRRDAPPVQDEAIPPQAAVSFEDALDPRKRDQIAESYLNRRKPIIGTKRSGK